jgi:isoleucyl-tRNA synthetase
MTKWNRIIEIRNAANKEIEVQRTQGLIGSSLQAQINIQANSEDIQLLNSLGNVNLILSVRLGVVVSLLQQHIQLVVQLH